MGSADKSAPQTRHVVWAASLYGAFLMCTSVLLWGGYLAALPETFGLAYRAAGYFSCGTAFALGFAAAAGVAYVRPTARAWRHPLVSLALVFCAGCLLIMQIHTGIKGATGMALSVAIGSLLGFASALFFCALQEMVGAMPVFACGIAVFAAAAISSALYLLLSPFPHDVAVWLVLFAFLPATAVAYAIAQKQNLPQHPHPMFQTVPSNNRARLTQAAADLWRPLLCVSFSAFLIGIIRSDTLINAGALASANDAGMIGLLIAAIVLLALWKTIYERTLLSKLQLLLFPLVATSFLLLPFLSGAGRGGFVAFAFTVFSIASSLMIVTCTRTARTYAIQPVLVYGVFAGVVYLFLVCGVLLSFFLGGPTGSNTLWLFAVALAAIYVLSMALTLGKRMMKSTREKKSAALAEDSTTSPSLEQQCAQVAEHYALTARETEVMTLLAHGRDVAFIAEELVISKNTVRTHVKGVFSKTGVHSKQELIDLVTLFEA